MTVPEGWPIHITWAAMALGIMAWGPGRLSRLWNSAPLTRATIGHGARGCCIRGMVPTMARALDDKTRTTLLPFDRIGRSWPTRQKGREIDRE